MPTYAPLDEPTLRQVFPAAPADARVPESVSALFKVKLREFREERAVWILAVAGLLVVGLLVLTVNTVVGLILAGGATIGAIGILVWLHSTASDAFWAAYATARGMRHSEGSGQMAGVPLMRKGDKRKWGHVLTGPIAGRDAQLALYTYTEVTTDSDGDRTETDYDWTIVSFRLPTEVAARFRGVYCRPRSLSLGGLQDRLAHDRGVELESSEFHSRYSLRVVDEQDDVALFELFSPPFIHLLATEVTVFWEQIGSDLVIYHKGHETEAADLDRMCLDACRVLGRYLEEWQ